MADRPWYFAWSFSTSALADECIAAIRDWGYEAEARVDKDDDDMIPHDVWVRPPAGREADWDSSQGRAFVIGFAYAKNDGVS